MSCENVQERISLLVDRNLPAGERETVLEHIGSCRPCGVHFEEIQKQRAMLLGIPAPAVPPALTARLQVLASHERERRLTRVNISARLRWWAGRVELMLDHLMRPVALPFTGGLLSAALIFAVIVPRLSFSHDMTGRELMIDPGTVATMPWGSAAIPATENVVTAASDGLNVVDMILDETGKVVDWSVVRGELTGDMKSIILFSHFPPASVMGMATSGKIRVIQAPPMTVRG